MKLIFAGSGSAFTIGDNNYQSNMLLEDKNGERLLIDCGTDARLSLYELGLIYKDIKQVYVSHIHADHAGGLIWLGITRYLDSSCEMLDIYMSENLMPDLWEKVLLGGVCSINGACLDMFFNPHLIAKNSYFTWSQVKFYIVPTIHGISESTSMACYGLRFNVDNLKVFITADANFYPDRFMNYYKEADIIFHDCETGEKISGVHSHYNDLITLDPEIKNKIWLYHYNPGPLPDAKKEGFRGFVKKGQSFDLTQKHTLF